MKIFTKLILVVILLLPFYGYSKNNTRELVGDISCDFDKTKFETVINIKLTFSSEIRSTVSLASPNGYKQYLTSSFSFIRVKADSVIC